MLAFKLAFRNLIGARLRTWLNVFVLSLAFVVIIWNKGILNGWDEQARHDTITWEIGGGQYWHPSYDPYDPFSIEKSHSVLSANIKSSIGSGKIVPELIAQGTAYTNGRGRNVLLKGVPGGQKILKLPTRFLADTMDALPVIIGRRNAKSNHLKVGDYFTIRWRDKNGTFDATEARVAYIFKTNVQTMDMNVLWLPLTRLQEMLQLPDEATILTTAQNTGSIGSLDGWVFRDQDFLLREITEMIKMKSIGGTIFFIILMSLAMLAIFDTQVLSIFRRQREIGTHIALGMTRTQVIGLFTLEGAMHAILAAVMAFIYGFPLLAWQARVGWTMPGNTSDFGMTIADTIYPSYTVGLVLGTTLIVLITTTIVSFLPTRRIARMNPTDAIRGKIQ